MKSSERGFTLIEMLIVIAIIVLLTAMILPSIRDILEQTRVTTAKGDCRTVKAALESYAIYHRGFYPIDVAIEGLKLLPGETPRIINRVPDDPFGLDEGASYQYATDYDFHTGDEGAGAMGRAYYWVVWSVGPRGSCRAGFIDGNGTLIVNDAGVPKTATGDLGDDTVDAPSPGVKTCDQIAYDTNATKIFVYALNDTDYIGES